MHTDSSASFTYFASVSAVECTTTVRMLISRQARWMRSAISPRLAIRIFSNTGLGDDEQRLAVLHRLPVLDQDGLDDAGGVGLDLVHQLHGLDDAHRLAGLDALPDLDEGLRFRRRQAVEGAHHRRFEDVAFGHGLRGRGRGARWRSGER